MITSCDKDSERGFLSLVRRVREMSRIEVYSNREEILEEISHLMDRDLPALFSKCTSSVSPTDMESSVSELCEYIGDLFWALDEVRIKLKYGEDQFHE